MRWSSIESSLSAEQWTRRRTATMWLEYTKSSDGPRLVITNPEDGTRVVVNGADELLSLIAFANDALPDGDARKIRTEMVEGLARLTWMDPELPPACRRVLAQLLAAMMTRFPHR